MEFILGYNNEEYLVIVSDFIKKDKAEVIRIPYSDEENDWVEYEIQVLKRKDDVFYKTKVLDLPEELKEIIGKNLREVLERTFIANPYFDELILFAGTEVFTYQEHLKPIECIQCNRQNLYEMRNKGKGNKSEYIERIKEIMNGEKNPDWPFKERLLVQFGISTIKSKLDTIDIDNMAKTILDIFKGLIYENDSQVIALAGDKNFTLGRKAFFVAIKRLGPNERPVFQEYLYSGKMNAWKDEHEEKRLLNKSTRFVTYGSFDENN